MDKNKIAEVSLRGAGQVIFQGHALTGLFFIFAIYVASVNAGNMAVLALLLSTSTGLMLSKRRASYAQGLYGYNGLLIGAMFATFFPLGNLGYLVAATIVATIVQIETERYFKRLPQLTYPFVLTSWVLCLILPLSNTATAFPQPVDVIFHNISQVFLIGNTWSGILILIGLAISSWKSAAWALGASIISIIVSHIFNIEVFGFSAVLTAVALGDQKCFKIILAILATILLQILMNLMLQPIPAFTAPFILITWLFLALSKVWPPYISFK
jgi:urea transporter